MTRSRFACAAVVALLLATPGCFGELEQCGGTTLGQRLQIKVLGPHVGGDGKREYCYRDWGFVEGNTLEGTVVDYQGDVDCKAGILETQGVEDWQWEIDPSGRVFGGTSLESWYSISKGECEARLHMNLTGPNSATYTLGSSEPCVLQIMFVVETEEACPSACSTELDVEVDGT